MNQLCPFCWTELQSAARTVSSGTRERSLPLLECPHCAAAGTSNLVHSHHAYVNAVKRVLRVIDRLEHVGSTSRDRDLAQDLRTALGVGLL